MRSATRRLRCAASPSRGRLRQPNGTLARQDSFHFVQLSWETSGSDRRARMGPNGTEFASELASRLSYSCREPSLQKVQAPARNEGKATMSIGGRQAGSNVAA